MQPGHEVATEVEQQLQKFQMLAKYRQEDESWLVAKWEHKFQRVVFGCKRCIAAISAGAVRLPGRYQDPLKSTSFIHYNIFKDVERGIAHHLQSKTHQLVMGIGGTPAALQVAAQERQTPVNTATIAEQLQDLIQGIEGGLMTQHEAARLLRKMNFTRGINKNLGHAPKRVRITEPIILKFGPTPGCMKCRAFTVNDKAYRYVHHMPECRERVTDLMRQDHEYRILVELADARYVQRAAELLERINTAAREQRQQQREEQQRSADAGARCRIEAFGSQSEEPGGPADAGTGDTGGASGSQVSGVDRKRRAEQQGQPGDRDEDGDGVLVSD